MGLSPELKAILDTAQEQRAVHMARMQASGQTLQQIASHFGLTRQRVHQILRAHRAADARSGYGKAT